MNKLLNPGHHYFHGSVHHVVTHYKLPECVREQLNRLEPVRVSVMSKRTRQEVELYPYQGKNGFGVPQVMVNYYSTKLAL